MLGDEDFREKFTQLAEAFLGDDIGSFLESNADLLGDSFLAFVKRLVRALESGDSERRLASLAKEILHLVIECRTVGIDAALARRQGAADLQEHVLDYVMALGDVDAQRAIVENYPDLLTPAADAILAQMEEGTSEYGKEQYRALRTILHDCRQHGHTEAFARAARVKDDKASLDVLVSEFVGAPTIEQAKGIIEAHPQIRSFAGRRLDQLIEALSSSDAPPDEKWRQFVEGLRARRELLQPPAEKSRLPEAGDAGPGNPPDAASTPSIGEHLDLKEIFLRLVNTLHEGDFDQVRSFVRAHPVVTSPPGRHYLERLRANATSEEVKAGYVQIERLLELLRDAADDEKRPPVHLVQPGSGSATNDEQHSYAERVTVDCLQCGHPISIDVWMILDLAEHPDLVKTISDSKLRPAACTRCGTPNLVDAPIMVYRAWTSPRLLVAPAFRSEPTDHQVAFLRLVNIVQDRLGDDWEDDLLNDTVLCKPWELQAALEGTSRPVFAEKEREANAWQAFLRAGTWNEMHEILEAWPGFCDERRRSGLKLVVEHARRVGDEVSSEAIAQRLALLAQSNAVGVDAAVLAAIAHTASRPLSSMVGDRATERGITIGVVPADVQMDAREERAAAEDPPVEQLIASIEKIPPSVPLQERARLLDEVARACLRRYPLYPGVLELALWYFRAALKITSASDRVARLATLVQVIKCYLELRRLGRPISSDLVLPYLEEAERYVDRQEDPVRWAMTQEMVATLVSERSPLTQADIEQSIAGHDRALEVFTKESHAHDWASIHNNLALLHGKSLVGDRNENVEISIAHSCEAVAVFHAIPAPQQEALARLNLASAYLERDQVLRGTGIDEAIYHLEAALEGLDRHTHPIEWATAHTNLATALLDRRQRRGDVDRTIIVAHLDHALEVLEKAAFPTEWADVQIQLGMTFSRSPVDVERAVQHYRSALGVCSETTTPRDWANIQHNLGVLYTNEAEAGRPEYAERAELHLKLALRVCTVDRFPAEHRQTQQVLGSLYFTLGHWNAAHGAFVRAATAGEQLIEGAYTHAGRRNEIAETTLTFARDAYALAKLGFYSESMVSLENGKTRLLNDALVASGIGAEALSDAERDALASARHAVRQLEKEEGFGADSATNRDRRAIAAELHQSRSKLAELVTRLRREHPDVFPVGCDEQGLLSLIPPRGALVALFCTGRGSAMFVIPHGATSIASEHLHWLDDVLLDAIRHLLGRWMECYRRRREDPRAWRATILETGKMLWDLLMEKVTDALESLKLERGAPVLFFPQGGLAVLPLHAAWSEGTCGRCYFTDRYTLTYAPSGYALRASQARLSETRRNGSSVLAIIDPTRDLEFASVEGAVLEWLFKTQVQRLDEVSATRTAVAQAATGCAFLHFACHGQYDWHTPARSALVLAQDERLTLANVLSELNLESVRLVTLSACETGLTDVRLSPDEYLGLPAAFLQAGAPGVVSTLWPVSDVSSALLMFDFYDRLAQKHESPADALAGAQRWLSRATNEQLSRFYERHKSTTERQPAIPAIIAKRQFRLHTTAADPCARPYEHPYHWAAFTFTGN